LLRFVLFCQSRHLCKGAARLRRVRRHRQIRQASRAKDRESQIGDRLPRVVAFCQSNRVDRSRFATVPAAQARRGGSEEIPRSSLAAVDAAVLATGRGTKDEKRVPIVRATNNGRRKQFPPESLGC